MHTFLRLPARWVVCTLMASCGSPFTIAPGSDGGAVDESAVSKDGAPADRVAEAAPGPVILCGLKPCAMSSQTCCINTNNTPTFACENGSGCSNPNDLAVHCESEKDCATSQVCCISQQMSNVTKCESQCGGGSQQLCDPTGSNTCPQGGQCSGGWGGLHLPHNVGVCTN